MHLVVKIDIGIFRKIHHTLGFPFLERRGVPRKEYSVVGIDISPSSILQDHDGNLILIDLILIDYVLIEIDTVVFLIDCLSSLIREERLITGFVIPYLDLCSFVFRLKRNQAEASSARKPYIIRTECELIILCEMNISASVGGK